MSTKQFDIDGIGDVTVSRSRRSKHLRISIKSDDRVVVSVPNWTPYKVALEYVKTKRGWISENRQERSVLVDGSRIGKAHRLFFEPWAKDTTRTYVRSGKILIRHPSNVTPDEQTVQKSAEKACIRALTTESRALLPQRLHLLAEKHNCSYNSVTVRTLRSRWGSCSTKKDIALNCYLIQLPWQEIDYVLLHELTHTEEMSHNAEFWRLLCQKMPNAKQVKKLVSAQKPRVMPLL